MPGPNNGRRLQDTIQQRRRDKNKAFTKIKIGTLNIISLTKRVEECTDVLKSRNLDILGLSETKWKGKGYKELRDGYHLYWSGGLTGKNGVGIILSNKMK